MSSHQSTAVSAPRRWGERPAGLIIALARDRNGSTAITFALMLILMMLSIGAAVDIGRWLQARSRTLAAIDAAVLAGGRMLQLNNSNPQSAVQSAMSYYQGNTADRGGVYKDTVHFFPVDNGTAFAAAGNAWIRTPFLSFAGIEELPLLNQSGSEFARSILAVGGNAQSSIEISMMLDITGSMSGQKIADLKLAAKDLIDIVVWADQSQQRSRVALVPFSEAVNVGQWANQVRGTPASGTCNTPGCLRYRFTRHNGSEATNQISTCVSERTGAHAYTDAPPSVAPVGRAYINSSGTCAPSNIIVPLTSNKTALKAAIDSYSANGVTAGHLGTAWAWYMLSPNWAYLWPLESQPESYAKTQELNSDGEPKLRKIAILMTDGEYNSQFCNGVPDRNTSATTRINCASPNGSSTNQARTMCTEMKKAGITLYSVGFALEGNQEAITTLRDFCASDSGKFYLADSGQQLRQSFRDIALKISALYLSK